MRFLHTSDWHLGQEFYRHDRSFEHAHFLTWLKDTIVEQKVDVLLIAGDLYDTANPPAAAQRMFYNFVREVKEVAKDLVIVAAAGNHDSPSRFEIPTEIFQMFSAHVIGRVASTPQGLNASENFLIPLFRKGEAAAAAVCVAIPYLRAADVYWQGETTTYPDAVLRSYNQALVQARQTYGSQVPLIGMGHMHASGGRVSEESERKLVIGGEEAVPLGSLAQEFAYIALGHLHLAQQVGAWEHVRYSGSPLPMSFSEIDYKHQVLCIELEPTGEVSIEKIPVPRSVQMLRCPREPQSLDSVVEALSQLNLPPCEVERRPFVEVPVHIDGPTPEMRTRIENALKDTPVRLGRIVVSRSSTVSNNSSQTELLGLENLRTIDPYLVFTKIHERDYGTPPAPELNRLFAEVLRDVNGEAEV